MSFESREEFNRFIEEQIQIVEEANAKITNNVVAHHAEFCDDPSEYCTAFYVEVFIQSFRQRLKAKNKMLGYVIHNPRIK